MLSFEGESLEAIIGEMRAFLAMVERPRMGTATAAADGTYTGPALPPCPKHLVEMVYHPAGRSARGKRLSASYRCARPDCREAVWLT